MCVENRIVRARQAYGMMQKIGASPKMSRDVKLWFLLPNVLSVLLSGCEIWKTSPSIVASMQTAHQSRLYQQRFADLDWPYPPREQYTDIIIRSYSFWCVA